jgi:hypothetical protein
LADLRSLRWRISAKPEMRGRWLMVPTASPCFQINFARPLRRGHDAEGTRHDDATSADA